VEKLLICGQVAERYGVKIPTVWGWIRAKRLPAIKTGKSYRIRPEDLEEYERRNKTTKMP